MCTKQEVDTARNFAALPGRQKRSFLCAVGVFLISSLFTAVQADKTSLPTPISLSHNKMSETLLNDVYFARDEFVSPKQQFSIARGGAARGKATEREKSGRLLAAFQWYMKSCTENPLLTKGITAGLIAALGDFIAQKLETRRNDPTTNNILSLERMTTFFAVNFLFTTPFVHYWYHILANAGNWVQERYGTPRWGKLLTQISLDQSVGVLIFFPLYLVFYYLLETIIQLHQMPSIEHALSKCQQHAVPVILMQYRLFPIANLINFAFVPEPLRVLFSNTVSLFWNIYLCSVVA
jgi:hypothetical protein